MHRHAHRCVHMPSSPALAPNVAGCPGMLDHEVQKLKIKVSRRRGTHSNCFCNFSDLVGKAPF